MRIERTSQWIPVTKPRLAGNQGALRSVYGFCMFLSLEPLVTSYSGNWMPWE